MTATPTAERLSNNGVCDEIYCFTTQAQDRRLFTNSFLSGSLRGSAFLCSRKYSLRFELRPEWHVSCWLILCPNGRESCWMRSNAQQSHGQKEISEENSKRSVAGCLCSWLCILRDDQCIAVPESISQKPGVKREQAINWKHRKKEKSFRSWGLAAQSNPNILIICFR
jgi:hypothetical protein